MLFATTGEARLNVEKEKIQNGMMYGGGEISKDELNGAIVKLKRDKAADDSGMIAEYVKALSETDREKLRIGLNDVVNGGSIPKEWKESRVVLIHKGGNHSDMKNYRPIAIISIVCKICMMIVRDRINEWVEETGMLGDVQGGFRRGRRTEDNLFMLERMMEMAKVRGECLYIGFMDMEKAYDRVNRRKLFEVMRSYGIHEKLIRTIERVYEDNKVKFELHEYITDWCKSDSGVRQGCPLSPLLFNINVRELGMIVQKSDNGFKYVSVGENGEVEDKTVAGFMYADDLCLCASSEDGLQRVMDEIASCITEYGMKLSERKSKVVCINGTVQNRKWRCGETEIREVEEYQYLGVTVQGGKNGGFKSMGDRMVEANGVIGMIKYAAKRSGNKYVIGREGWKGIAVSKLMYGCGALAWYQTECDDLEVKQNDMGRWLWTDCRHVRNELIRGETGWSTFEEREAKAMSDWAVRLVFEENKMSEIGRACLIEIGARSRWWCRMRHICNKFGLNELMNLICLGDMSIDGMLISINLNKEMKGWKRELHDKIQLVGRDRWIHGFSDRDREQEYVRNKGVPMNEQYANGSIGASVRLMIRGGSLPVRGDDKMKWKYETDPYGDKCKCGKVETEMHVLLECKLYERERSTWLEVVEQLAEGANGSKLERMKGYGKVNERVDASTLLFLGKLWNNRRVNESMRAV